MDTPRDQRTPGEVATYLKGRFRPKPEQRQKGEIIEMGNYMSHLRAYGGLGSKVRRLGSMRIAIRGH